MTVQEVVKTLHTNAATARLIAEGLLQDVYDVVKEGKALDEIKGCMQYSCVTREDVSPDHTIEVWIEPMNGSCSRKSRGRSWLISYRTTRRNR